MLPYLLVVPIAVFYGKFSRLSIKFCNYVVLTVDLALSLASCVSTSPAIPELFIVSLQPSKNTSAPAEVRLGYFGICARSNGSEFSCQRTSGASADTVFANLFHVPGSNTTGANATAAANSDAKDLISNALVLQSQIFISILAGAAFLFLVSLVLLVFLRRSLSDPFPEKPGRVTLLKRVTWAVLFLSVALVFTASLATSETAGALQYSSGPVTQSPFTISPGISLQVLQWMTFGFSLLFAMAELWILRPKVNTGGDPEK